MSSPKCPTCGKTVYFAERVSALGKVYHKVCLKCVVCSKTLPPGKISNHGDKIYCNACYGSNVACLDTFTLSITLYRELVAKIGRKAFYLASCLLVTHVWRLFLFVILKNRFINRLSLVVLGSTQLDSHKTGSTAGTTWAKEGVIKERGFVQKGNTSCPKCGNAVHSGTYRGIFCSRCGEKVF
mmetsp:Transcript_23649/g.26226  ORF Transcript_23649/g.26226 Transcript_23649/m.26226 type:complete len:183 (+) Transcript_23649:2-550(+)